MCWNPNSLADSPGYLGNFAGSHRGDPPMTMARAQLVDGSVTRWYRNA